jgi:hypothetical protein
MKAFAGPVATNDDVVAKIMKMTEAELLDLAIDEPENLTDAYYRVFGDAMRARHDQLKAARGG